MVEASDPQARVHVPGRDGSHEARQPEDHKLHAGHRHPREPGGALARADGVDPAPEHRPVENEPDEERREQQQGQGDRDGRPGHPLVVDADEAGGNGQRTRPQHRLGNASVGGHRRQRHHEGGQAQIGDERAVRHPERHPKHQRERQDERRRPARRQELRPHTSYERQHRRHREVDVAANDDQRHRQSHEADLEVQRRLVEEIPRVEEVGGQERPDAEREDGQQRRDQLRPAQ